MNWFEGLVRRLSRRRKGIPELHEYQVIAPPFTLAFREMSKEELRQYYAWYLEQIPGRLAQLEWVAKCTPGFEDWKADYSPQSLNRLGEWFALQVEKRPRTKEEIERIYAESPAWFRSVTINDWELTDRTFSMAIDVGMYLAQVFLKNNPTLKWQHTTKGSKRWVDYGQPVLAGFGLKVFNPVGMLYTQAYGIARGRRKGNSLRELYEIWSKMVTPA